MAKKDDCFSDATRTIRFELNRKEVTYKNLSKMLAANGVSESPEQLKAKINRGKFSFVFFVQVMNALGVHTIHIQKKIPVDAVSNQTVYTEIR